MLPQSQACKYSLVDCVLNTVQHPRCEHQAVDGLLLSGIYKGEAMIREITGAACSHVHYDWR